MRCARACRARPPPCACAASGAGLSGASTVPSRATSPCSQREIFALHRARLQLAHQVGLRFQRLGDDQQAAGVLVQPMHDARARNGGELRAWCSRALSSVPSQLPLPGCTTRPAGLLSTSSAASSYTMSSAMSSAARRAARGVGLRQQATGFLRPRPCAWHRPRHAVERHLALLDPACRRLREYSGNSLRQRLVEAHSGASIGRERPAPGGRRLTL